MRKKKRLTSPNYRGPKPFDKLKHVMFLEEYNDYVKKVKSHISYIRWIESKRIDQRIRVELRKRTEELVAKKVLKKDILKKKIREKINREDYYLDVVIDNEEQELLAEEYNVDKKYVDILYKISKHGDIKRRKNYFLCNNIKFCLVEFEEVNNGTWKINPIGKKQRIGVGKFDDGMIVAVSTINHIITHNEFRPVREFFL